MPMLPSPHRDERQGIDGEISRLRAECLDMALRADGFRRAGDLGREITLRRALNSSRDTLRKLETSVEELVAASGRWVLRAEVERDVSRLLGQFVAALDGLPTRCVGLIAGDTTPVHVGTIISEEVHRMRVGLGKAVVAGIATGPAQPEQAALHLAHPGSAV
jgi:hypothetical protein